MCTDEMKLKILNGEEGTYNVDKTTHRLFQLRKQLEQKPFLRYCLEKSLCQKCDLFLEKNDDDEVIMINDSLISKKKTIS
jgi:hypothetical protein